MFPSLCISSQRILSTSLQYILINSYSVNSYSFGVSMGGSFYSTLLIMTHYIQSLFRTILQMVTAAMNLKDDYSLKGKS